MKTNQKTRHLKEPDPKGKKKKFERRNTIKNKLTFKQKIRRLPKWIKLIILVIMIPIVVILETLFNLLIKIFKPIFKYILHNFVSFIILVILISTIYMGYLSINNTNDKIEQINNELTNQINIQNEKDTQTNETLQNIQNKQTELEEKQNQLEISKAEQKAAEEAKKAEEEKALKLAQAKQVTSRSGSIERTTTTMATTGTKSEYQSYARDLCLNTYGWTENDFNCLVKLWERESNWNPLAKNSSSGAYGICQSLPASKMASEGSDYLTNYKTQIRWGLKYIKNRYGSPSNAWAHSQSTGWY